MPVKLSDASVEDVVIDYLTLRDYTVKKAGSRHQRYDLEIVGNRWVSHDILQPTLNVGKYEVKSLYRAKPSHAFDRRFKVGSRGESIYGRRDAEIKSLALDIENWLDHGIFPMVPRAVSGTTTIDEMHDLIDAALQRRHSKSFIEKFTAWAEVYDDVWSLSSASVFLDGGIKGNDIVGAFSDIDGIIIMAGAYFTMVANDEFAEFFDFDSVSAEGVKLRYIGMTP